MKKLSVLLIVLILIGLSGCTSNAPTIKTFNAIKDGDKICVTYKVLDEKEKIKDMYLELNDTKYELDKLEDNVYLDTDFSLENKVKLVIKYGLRTIKSKEINFDIIYKVKFHIDEQTPLIIDVNKNSSLELPTSIYLDEYGCVAKIKDMEKYEISTIYFSKYEYQTISCIVQCDWYNETNRIEKLDNICSDTDLYASNVSIQEAIMEDDKVYVGEILKVSNATYKFPEKCYHFENDEFKEYKHLRFLDYADYFDTLNFMNNLLSDREDISSIETIVIPSIYTKEYSIPRRMFSGTNKFVTIIFYDVKELSSWAFVDLKCNIRIKENIKSINKEAFVRCNVSIELENYNKKNIPYVDPNYAWKSTSILKTFDGYKFKINTFEDGFFHKSFFSITYNSHYNINDRVLSLEWSLNDAYDYLLDIDKFNDAFIGYKFCNEMVIFDSTIQYSDEEINKNLKDNKILSHKTSLCEVFPLHSRQVYFGIEMDELKDKPKYLAFSFFVYREVDRYESYRQGLENKEVHYEYSCIDENIFYLCLEYEGDEIFITRAFAYQISSDSYNRERLYGKEL